jgi:hypothetical protein
MPKPSAVEYLIISSALRTASQSRFTRRLRSFLV